jgi:hypothetical protein
LRPSCRPIPAVSWTQVSRRSQHPYRRPTQPYNEVSRKLFVIIFLWVYAVVSETTKCDRVDMGKEPGLMKNKTKQRIIMIPYLFRYFIPFSRLHPQNILSGERSIPSCSETSCKTA